MFEQYYQQNQPKTHIFASPVKSRLARLSKVTEGATNKKPSHSSKNLTLFNTFLGFDPKQLKNFSDEALLKSSFETVLDSAEKFVKSVIFNLWNKNINLKDLEDSGNDSEPGEVSSNKIKAGVVYKVASPTTDTMFDCLNYPLITFSEHDNDMKNNLLLKNTEAQTNDLTSTENENYIYPVLQPEKINENPKHSENVFDNSLRKHTLKNSKVTTSEYRKLELQPCVVLDMLNFALQCSSIKPESKINSHVKLWTKKKNMDEDDSDLSEVTETVNNCQQEIPSEPVVPELLASKRKFIQNSLEKEEDNNSVAEPSQYFWLENEVNTLSCNKCKPCSRERTYKKRRNKGIKDNLNSDKRNIIPKWKHKTKIRDNSKYIPNVKSFPTKEHKINTLETDSSKSIRYKNKNEIEEKITVQSNQMFSNDYKEEWNSDPIKIAQLNAVNDYTNDISDTNEDYHPNIKKMLQYLVKLNKKKKEKTWHL